MPSLLFCPAPTFFMFRVILRPFPNTHTPKKKPQSSQTPASSSVGAVAPSVSSDIDADLIRILTAFVSKLCAHESLTTREATIITSLIGQSDSVILSAYKVAEWVRN